MSQLLQFLLLIISIITITFLLSFLVYAIRNRHSEGAISFAVWLGLTIGWLFVQNFIPYLPEHSVLTGLRVELIFMVLVPPTYFLFNIHFTAHKNWIRSWRQVILFILPIITLVLGLLDSTRSLIWNQLVVVQRNTFNEVQFTFGQWQILFWVFTILVCAVVFIELIRFGRLSKHVEKSQLLVFQASALMLFVFGNLSLIGSFQPIILRVLSLGFGISGILIGFSIFHYQLFDLSPVVYQSLLKNIQDAIIVINDEQRILHINPKAEELLGIKSKQSLGKILHSFLPVSSPWLNTFIFKQKELIVPGSNGMENYYEIQYSSLVEDRYKTNELILIRDMTQNRASKLAEKSVREMAEVRAMELDVLRKVAEQLNRSVQFDEVMSNGLETVVSLIGARFGYVVLADEYGRPGLAGSYKLPEEVRSAFEVYPICPACKSFERLLNGDYQEPVTFMPCRILFDVSISYPGLISIPLKLGERRIGFLHLVMAPEVVFTGDEILLLQTLGDQFSAAVERARMYENFEKLAMIDSLTGLYNRRQLFNLGQVEFSRACRYNHAISVIMLDIDLFKKVNDVYGHLIGDQVLQQIATRCRSVLRSSDIIGRYGGEEFVILLPETGIHHAQSIANRIRLLVLDKPIMTDRGEISVSISLGVSSMEGDCDSRLEWVVDQADQSLLRAKDLGRNRVVIWQTDQFPLYKNEDKSD